jgi:uncharacterized protein YceH (UPF0502 family)
MSDLLTDVDIRVLGSLIEKQLTTPEYYPLSLNALVTACNQSSNRDPIVKFDESTVDRSIAALRQRGLVRGTKGVDARVTKYAHRVDDVMGLKAREIAVLGVLMLRGPQTTGELRVRASRLEPFADIAEVEATLAGLIARELVVALPRQRYAHLLAGPPSAITPEEELRALRQEVTELRAEVKMLRARLAD